MSMVSVRPNEAQGALMDGLKAAIGEHSERLTGLEILAVVSQLVGNITAFQDAERYTPQMVMDVVAANITEGNAMALRSAMGKPN